MCHHSCGAWPTSVSYGGVVVVRAPVVEHRLVPLAHHRHRHRRRGLRRSCW